MNPASTTPANHGTPTPFGFHYYPHHYTGESIYFRPDDPKVEFEKPWTATTGHKFGGWKDNRTSEQQAADQISAKAAAAEYQAAVDRQAAQNQRTEDWRKLFHSKAELENAPKFTFAIDIFLQEKGITMIGGRSGDGKTLIAMEMAKCLLEGSPLFGHFEVKKQAKRVIYLIPESGLGPFAMRTKLFGLLQHADDRFFSRTLDSKDPHAPITDPAILKACEGADVFLDTAVRFMEGDENAASDSKRFADNLFALLRAGARTVTGLHHAPKQFSNAQHMSLENLLRGSGDIGAMLAACWGVAQVDRRTTDVYIENVKARDFDPCDSFIITGRPSINETGHFAMKSKPGLAGSYQQQRAKNRVASTDKQDAGRQLLDDGKSVQEVAAALGVTERTVRNWRMAKATETVSAGISG